MSCIINDYSLGVIAQHGLLQDDYKTRMLPKLDVEYLRHGAYNFIHVSFNNQIAQGMKFSQWIGRDYFELTLDRVSIPSERKSTLNLKITLIHINEAQELAQLAITGHTHIAGRACFSISCLSSD